MLGVDRTAVANSASRLKPKCHEHGEGHEHAPRQQQHGLDDLHPSGREHAAEGDVDDHQDADDDDRHPVVQPEQDLDQLAGADHLGDQVERHDDNEPAAAARMRSRSGQAGTRRHRQRCTCRGCAAVRRSGSHHGPADKKADRVDQPVIPGHETDRKCRETTPRTYSRRRSRCRSARR